MFIKAFSPDHFNHGGDAPFEILRFSAKGLDRAQEKRANMFSKLVDGYTPSKDKTAVHTIAMTAFEKFGFNRNGDGWKRANLMRDHPTFISHAKVYRHHKNTPADPSFGVVKAAMYNEDMDRVELLMELDNTKCAEELSLLERDGSYPVSMACKIAYDVCSICSNKAKTPREYCHHVKEAMGKILDDGRIVGVDNPNSTFFDISRVIRPADRVAYTLKTASASGAVGGAALAEELGYTLGYTEALDASLICNVKAAQDKKAVLDKLSKMEKRIEGEVRPILIDDENKVQECVKKLSVYIPTYLDSVMKAMTKESVLLRPSEFYTLMTGNTLNAADARNFNNGAFKQALAEYNTEDLTNSSLYEPALLGVGGKIAELCSELKTYRGVNRPIFGRIAGTAQAPVSSAKQASTTFDSNWAKEYVRYQLEIYKNIKNSCAASELDEALFCGLCQNTVE